MIRVLVADDSVEIRAMVRIYLETKGFEVCGEAGDGLDAVAAAQAAQPDAVVLDVLMPELDGLTALPLIKEASPATKVIVFSSRPLADVERAAWAAGADAYVEKQSSITRLVDAMAELFPVAEPA